MNDERDIRSFNHFLSLNLFPVGSLIHPILLIHVLNLGRVYCIIFANVQVLLILKDPSNLYLIINNSIMVRT